MLYTEPHRAIPWIATDEPILAKLRKAREDPRCKKSNTDVEDPNLEIPVMDTEEPNREKERIEKLLPKCTKSRTDRDDPMRAKLRKTKNFPNGGNQEQTEKIRTWIYQPKTRMN